MKNKNMKYAKRAGASRGSFERMIRIHELLQNKQYPNCTKLGKEFEVVKRTVMRDIEFMKDRFNLPLEFDSLKNGYFYSRPVDHFPELPLSEADVFGLLVANKAIEQYRGTPFQRLLETAFRRLTGRLDAQSMYSMGSVEGVVSFHPFAPGDADLETFELLTRAVRERRVVQFLYRNRGQLNAQKRQVHPLHVAYVDNHWCLFGFDVGRKDTRTFVLSRLSKPTLTGEKFAVTKKFDLEDYLRGSLGVFKGKDDHEVVVEFDLEGADDVRGRRWHSSQKLEPLAEGRLRVTMRLNNLEEAEKWVLGFGTHATVVGPKELRERLAAMGREIGKRYGGDR